MSPSALVVPLALIPLALLAACAPYEPVDDFQDESRMDGFAFERDLKPMQLELNSLDGSQFQDKRYVSYEFSLAETNEIQITSSFGIKHFLENLAWGVINLEPYQVSHVLFSYDDGAQEWDLVARHNGHRFNVDLDKGRYMFLVLGSKSTYTESLPITTELVGRNKIAVAPGDLYLRVITDKGRDAANLRVAIGATSGYTDATGAVVLENIPRGDYEVKFGDAGLQRAPEFEQIFIIGKRHTQKRALILSASDYAAWKR